MQGFAYLWDLTLVFEGSPNFMIIDTLVLVVLLISAVIAFLRGFIREVLTIAGVLGGSAAAYIGGPVFVPTMHGWLGVEADVEPEKLFGMLPYDLLGTALAYGLIFVVVVLVLSVISHFLAEGARSLGLGAIDRTLGFIFGLARGIVLLGLLYLPVHLFIEQEAKDQWFEGSRTHFYIAKVSDSLSGFLPEDAKDKAGEGIDAAKEANSARKKLEDIRLLDGGEKPASRDAPNLGALPSVNEGYSEEFREKMDRLFEDEGAMPPTPSAGNE